MPLAFFLFKKKKPAPKNPLGQCRKKPDESPMKVAHFFRDVRCGGSGEALPTFIVFF